MSLKNTSYFNPTLISGCTLWLDGADPAGNGVIPANGASVSTWVDKSASGNAPNVLSGLTYSRIEQNTLGTVNFGNFTGYLSGTITPALQNSVMSCFFIFKLNGTTSDNGIHNVLDFANGPNGDLRMLEERAGDFRVITRNPNTTGIVIPANTGIYNVWFSGQNTTNLYARLNGKSLTSVSISANTSNSSQYGIGTNFETPFATPSGWNGYVGEVIIYNSLVSLSQQEQVEGYLAWKWRLTSSLPVSHPYALSPSYGLPSLVPNAPAKTSITYANHPVVTIGGCALWFDGADPLGTGNAPENGTSLTTWVNKGITTVTLAHGTSQPTYSANFQNGLGSVSFNNNYFSAAYSFNLQTKSAFIVCSQSNNATDSPQGILSFYGSGLDTVNSTNGYGYQATQGGYGSFGWLYNIFAGGATGYYIATGTAGANTPMGIYGNVFSNQFEQTFKDGSSVTNFTITTTPGTSTNLMVGARLISGGLRGSFFGNICEIIVYNVALSSAQRQTIEGYLAQKWGLTANLPAGHPHKSSFPLFPSPVTGLRRVAGRRWSPLTPGGCVLWLDGSDSSTFTLSSTSITQWRDKSGNGNHMANNGTGPIYNGSLINSLGGIDCTNGGSLISSGFQNSANLSFAMVAVVKSGLGFWGSFFTHGGRDNDFAVERNSVVGSTIHFQTANDNSQCGIAYTVDAPVLYYGTMTSGTSRFFQSFSGGTNTITTGTNSSTISLGSQLARVGKSDNNEVCNSFIGEIIYYTAVLSATQQQQVEGYLAWKWGLRASLPSSHPYKLFPPSP